MKSLQWLIRREFWENKGGFFWAPVIAGIVFIVLNILGLAVGIAAAGRAHVQIGLVKLDALLQAVDPKAMAVAAMGIDMSVAVIAWLVSLVTAIVVFFYCLGSNYDERKDRSILFWKSLPLSDRDTVLSKALSALIMAPLIGMVAGLITAFGTLLVIALVLAFKGQNVFGLLFWQAHPFKMTLLYLSTLPISALWALPTVGWLMLCSAWARSKPFLWAVGVPVGVGIMVSWFDLMQTLAKPDIWFWEHVVGRLLFSVVPGGWMDSQFDQLDNITRPEQLADLASLSTVVSGLNNPDLWSGTVIGVAMLFAATRLRRWRDEA